MESSPIRGCAAFGLQHRRPQLFVSPHYRMSYVWYVWYRLAMALYMTLLVTMDFIVRSDQSPWVYFTSWSYTLQTIAMLVKAGNVLQFGYTNGWESPSMLTRAQRGELKMRWFHKAQWILHNYTSSIPYLVSATYWIFLWRISEVKQMRDPVYVHFTVQLHAINSVLALLDTLLGATPTRLQHFYQPVCCVLTYTLFSVLHALLTDVGPIYPFLDWARVGTTLGFVLAGLLAVALSHLAVWAIKRLQRQRCNGYVQELAEQWTDDDDGDDHCCRLPEDGSSGREPEANTPLLAAAQASGSGWSR